MGQPIRIVPVDDRFRVEFSGNKYQFNSYMKALSGIVDKQFDFTNRSWLVTKQGIAQLKYSLGDTELAMFFDLPATPQAKSSGELISSLKFPLYEYQEECVKFILATQGELNVLPCGAGKTPILIAAYNELKTRGEVTTPGVIVVKASLKVQWEHEVRKFSTLVPAIIRTSKDISASALAKVARREAKLQKPDADKAKIRAEIAAIEKEAREQFKAQFKAGDLLILNYETLRDIKVRQELHKIKPEFIAPDEIHYIKNQDTVRAKALYEFAYAKYRLGATATPVTKNPEDLFGIMKFIQPTLYPKHGQFAMQYIKYAGFGKISGFKNLNHLRDTISPYLFVRSKQEVSAQLPSLLVMQRYCEPEPAQVDMNEKIMAQIQDLKEQERSVLARMRNELEARTNKELQKISAMVMAHQTFAQELCISEQLLSMSESEMAKEFVTGSNDNKMDLAIDLIDEILDSGEKVVIFSRFQRMQEVLTNRIQKAKLDTKISYVDGSMTSQKRYEEVYTKFQNHPDYKVLLCSDAGAEGLNLSGCKYMIEMELADSYGRQTQRHGRIERADSVHDTVFVFQLMMQGMYDEIQAKIVAKKEGFDAELIRA